jgi:hypothetical protein
VTAQTLIFLLISNLCFGQKDLIGLFGKCDGNYSGYMCQQVLFKNNKTFVFYDLLHLRGWTLSEGTWKKNADTIILNSTKFPFIINYKGTSLSDSVTMYFTDSIDPVPFVDVRISSRHFETNLSGTFKCSRHLLDTIAIFFNQSYSGPIYVDKEKCRNTDTLEVKLARGIDYYGKTFFNNEKWFLQNKKLFHSQDSIGNFSRDKYFDKVKLTDLKYRKDY